MNRQSKSAADMCCGVDTASTINSRASLRQSKSVAERRVDSKRPEQVEQEVEKRKGETEKE